MRPNPSLKRMRQRQATRPGLAVRGTFSPDRAWRPTVVARLARTLGSTRNTANYTGRKCACRRGLNSHEETEPTVPVSPGVQAQHTEPSEVNEQPDCSQGRRKRRPVQTRADAARDGASVAAARSGRGFPRTDERARR